jgi:hypothetical protein
VEAQFNNVTPNKRKYNIRDFLNRNKTMEDTMKHAHLETPENISVGATININPCTEKSIMHLQKKS